MWAAGVGASEFSASAVSSPVPPSQPFPKGRLAALCRSGIMRKSRRVTCASASLHSSPVVCRWRVSRMSSLIASKSTAKPQGAPASASRPCPRRVKRSLGLRIALSSAVHRRLGITAFAARRAGDTRISDATRLRFLCRVPGVRWSACRRSAIRRSSRPFLPLSVPGVSTVWPVNPSEDPLPGGAGDAANVAATRRRFLNSLL